MSGPEQTGGSVVLTGSERNTRLNVAMTNFHVMRAGERVFHIHYS